MYSKQHCPYCIRAKELLEKKNLEFEIIDIQENEETRSVMVEKSGGLMTVPQIFINDNHIGGYEDLKELDEKNGLEKRIKE